MRTKTKIYLITVVILLISVITTCLIRHENANTNIDTNFEALSQTEAKTYFNAKAAYCSPYTERIGCESAFLRSCTGVFCE